MSTLQMVFVGLASCLMLFWLVIALFGPRKIDAPGVLVSLRYGAALRILALILAWASAGVTIYVLWNFHWRSERALLGVGAGFLAASVISGLLLIEVERTHFAITEDSIIRQSPWTGKCAVAWNEVTRISYSPLNRWFIVTAGTRTIRISRHLSGIPEFVRIAQRKLATDRYSGVAALFEACSR